MVLSKEGKIVKAKVFVPTAPKRLVAERLTRLVPAMVGIPEIVLAERVKPSGNGLAPNSSGTGLPLVVMV